MDWTLEITGSMAYRVCHQGRTSSWLRLAVLCASDLGVVVIVQRLSTKNSEI